METLLRPEFTVFGSQGLAGAALGGGSGRLQGYPSAAAASAAPAAAIHHITTTASERPPSARLHSATNKVVPEKPPQPSQQSTPHHTMEDSAPSSSGSSHIMAVHAVPAASGAGPVSESRVHDAPPQQDTSAVVGCDRGRACAWVCSSHRIPSSPALCIFCQEPCALYDKHPLVCRVRRSARGRPHAVTKELLSLQLAPSAA